MANAFGPRNMAFIHCKDLKYVQKPLRELINLRQAAFLCERIFTRKTREKKKKNVSHRRKTPLSKRTQRTITFYFAIVNINYIFYSIRLQWQLVSLHTQLT